MIFGCGRSGTSMIGGILHDAGYFMGLQLYPPTISNPKGYFENDLINGINERILSYYDHSNLGFFRKLIKCSLINTSKWYSRTPRVFKKYLETNIHCPGYNQRWLSSIPVEVLIECMDSTDENKIKLAIQRKPFAYKDPRFSYTLPVWKKFLSDDVVLICIFRDPCVTVKSIIKECSTANYLRNFQINESNAYEVWDNIYSHIIDKHLIYYKQIIFCHYEQIYSGSALKILSKALNIDLKQNFVEMRLNRTRSNGTPPKRSQTLYSELCNLANYNPDN